MPAGVSTDARKGLFIVLSTLSGGGSVVWIDAAGLDPARVWSEVERNAIEVLTIVGDVFARPLLTALDAEPTRWDLSSLREITSSGVTGSPETKAGLLRHVQQVTLSTRSARRRHGEPPGRHRRRRRDQAGLFRGQRPGQGVPRGLRRGGDPPGSDEIGLLAVGGRMPVGYWRDPDKTAQTFRVIDGRRYALAGDYAQVDADGTIRLLGRGSACINTGGEKVYPEEVELALRKHPSVFDCVAVGVPDDRFGEIVVAIVQVTEKATTSTSPSSKRGVAASSPASRSRGGSCSSTRSSATPPARRTIRFCASWPRKSSPRRVPRFM